MKSKSIIVDAGNTRIKVGVFESDELTDIHVFTTENTLDLGRFLEKHKQYPLFVSSVLTDEKNLELFGDWSPVYLTNASEFNFENLYDTPNTLGKDRIANAAFLAKQAFQKNAVVIDFGTCIKFDFVNSQNQYLGGSISPGLQMRYEALNHFTQKLPLLAPKKGPLVGSTTEDSIHSGIIEGIKGEIFHMISRYEIDYKDLTFFVTGGDSKFFEFPSKSNIFAVENLTLLGLFYLYQLNA